MIPFRKERHRITIVDNRIRVNEKEKICNKSGAVRC